MLLNSLSAGYSEAAKWGETLLIQQKANVTAKNAMTDEFVAKLQEQARKDAQKGVGMSEESVQMCHAQMAKYVSPDRSGPMAQMTQELAKAAREHKEYKDSRLEFFDRMLAQIKKGYKKHILKSFSGLKGGCSGDLHSTPENQVATVYSPDGEEIAHYNTSSGGWQIMNTQAENRFLRDSTLVYKQAYDAARAEIKSTAQSSAAARGEPASFNAWA